MGMFFDYTPGRIDARFRHAARSYTAVLRVRMSNAIVTTTPSDENWKLGESTNHMQRAVDESVFISSIFCPFHDLVRFLEAVCLQVQECAFEWDAEGPTGRMEWQRRFTNDTGFLTLKWDGRFRGYERKFEHRMMLDTRQMVRMLYTAFRRFVESPEYDPIRYEDMQVGEAFSLVLNDRSIDNLAEVAVNFEAWRAESLLYQLRGVVAEHQYDGKKISYPLQHYIELSKLPVKFSEAEVELGIAEINTWIDKDWNSWDRQQRMAEVKRIFECKGLGCDGANLRKLRSALVEDWLAQPEPERISPFGIPHRGDVAQPAAPVRA